MKKIIFAFCILFSALFYIGKVDAEINIHAYSSGSVGIDSTKCKGSRCMSSYGYTLGENYNFSDTAIYGVRITIVDKNSNVKAGPKNFWAAQNMKDAVTGGITLANYSNGVMSGTNIYADNIGLPYKDSDGNPLGKIEKGATYSEYIASLDKAKVSSIIEHMGLSISEVKNYYIKFEPIYVLAFACKHSGGDDSCDNDIYFIGGTSYEILNFGFNQLDDKQEKSGYQNQPARFWFKYIARDDGAYDGNGNNVWNIIKNFTLSTYVLTAPTGTNFSQYGGSGCTNIDKLEVNKNVNVHLVNQMLLKNTCNARSSLGTGYLTISDYITPPTNKECNVALKEIKETITDVLKKKKELINLYNTEKQKGNNYSSLLNFDNPSCTEIPVTNQIDCLSGSISSSQNFSENNLSYFADQISIPGTLDTAFCQATLKATSEVGNGPFWSNSGQMYINSSTGKATTLTLQIKCYTPTSSTVYGKFSAGTISDYLTNVSLGELDGLSLESLTPSVSLETPIEVSNTGIAGEYKSAEIKVSYYFKKIYSEIGTGIIKKVNYNEVLSDSNYKFLGYGRISKLTDDYKNKKISFEIAYRQNNKDETLKGECIVSVTPEIIIREKPNLVFRTVNIKNGAQFLNSAGTVRKPGSNWKGYESIITTNNNSYNKNGQAPKYEIRLTPSIIRDIRRYNKKTKYDDYNLTCESINENQNGEIINNICISNYLTTLKTKYGLKINNSKIRACFEDIEKCKLNWTQ